MQLINVSFPLPSDTIVNKLLPQNHYFMSVTGMDKK